MLLVINMNTWVEFWGSVVGGLIGLIGVIFTIIFASHNTRKQIKNSDALEKQGYENKQEIIDKQNKINHVNQMRDKAQRLLKNIDNILAPVSSMKSKLFRFYPPPYTPKISYKEFTKSNNISIGRKYIKLTHNCLDKLLSENFIMYDNQSIRDLLQKCIDNLSYLWHILNGQFSLTDKTSGLIYEVKYKHYTEIQEASKLLYKNAASLDKHKSDLDTEFSNFIKRIK